MNEKYHDCPTCGSPCKMVETDEVGRYRLVSINNNSELRAFVKRVARMNLYEWDNELVEYLPSDLPNQAKVLLLKEEGEQ